VLSKDLKKTSGNIKKTISILISSKTEINNWRKIPKRVKGIFTKKNEGFKFRLRRQSTKMNIFSRYSQSGC